MPTTVFSTDVLLGVVEGLKTPNPALLERYFPTIQQSEAEQIHFDTIKSRRRIAPFVSPLVAGKVVESQGWKANTFSPAYIKDKRRFDPDKPFKRIAGEQIGGRLTPQQRLDAYLATELDDQVNMVTRRLEVMASEALRTAKVTVTGEGYGTVVVDFGRDPALTPAALAGTDKWTDPGSTPLDDLQDWSDLVLEKSGTTPVDVVMGVAAWKAFRTHDTVAKRLDVLRIQNNGIDVGAQQIEGLTPRGTIDGFNIWTYGGWYEDPDTGAVTPIWPADIVGMASALVEGVRAFGGIKDPKAGAPGRALLPKMWIEEDPAVTWLMLQAAPLVVPTRPDATLAVDVV
ncbi:MAG: major capsid protein [Gemmatimonadetes bacterium]|nr:major capsid protein [Gemmatimonadota bacterium]